MARQKQDSVEFAISQMGQTIRESRIREMGYGHRQRLTRIKLSEINTNLFIVRSGDWTVGTDPEEMPFNELVKSIEELGQLEPGMVRENGNANQPYDLVLGFRRFAAIKYVVEREGWGDGYFDTIIRELTLGQVIQAQLASNTRVNYVAPDLAFALETYAKEWESALSDRQVAAALGINPAYAAVLLRIVRKAPGIAKRWQEAPVLTNVGEMNALANLPVDKQMPGYESLINGYGVMGIEQEESAPIDSHYEEMGKSEFIRRAAIQFSARGTDPELCWDKAKGLWNSKPEDC